MWGRHINYHNLCVTVHTIEQEIHEDDKRRKKLGRAHHLVSTAHQSSVVSTSNQNQNSAKLMGELQKQIQALSNQLDQLTTSVTE